MSNRRRPRGTAPAPRLQRSPASPASAAQPPEPPPDTLLVGVTEDLYLLFGDAPPELDLSQVLLTDDQHRALGDAVAKHAALANLPIQAAQGLQQASGLVRLAPQTLKAMGNGAKPLTQNGVNLGALQVNGKIVEQVRWLPATSAGATAVLASIGPAAALLALQVQMGQILKLQRRTVALVTDLQHEIRSERWADVHAHVDCVLAGFRHARKLGAVTDDVWQHVQAQSSETALRGHRGFFLESITRHQRRLRTLTGARDRREWMADNAEAVLRDAESLVLSDQGWLVYQVLRAANLAAGAESDPTRRDLQQVLIEEARETQRETLDLVDGLLDALYRHFRLMQLCPGGMGLTIRGRNATPQEVADTAEALAEQIAVLRGRPCTPDEYRDGRDAADGEPVPRLGWAGPPEPRADIMARLRWLLERDEELLVVASHSTDPFSTYPRAVAYTSRRVLVLGGGEFRKLGQPKEAVDWGWVKSLSLTGPAGKLTIERNDHEYVPPRGELLASRMRGQHLAHLAEHRPVHSVEPSFCAAGPEMLLKLMGGTLTRMGNSMEASDTRHR